MSAWRIGAEVPVGPVVPRSQTGGTAHAPTGGTPAGGGGAPGPGGPDGPQTTIDKIVKWIPGDALALYAAAVTAFAAKSGARPSVVLLIVFVALAGVLVPLSTFASSGTIPARTLLPAVLAAVAFLIWSLTMPFSGWQRWDFVHDHQAEVAVVAAVVALLFGLVAEGLTKRAGASD
jgi:hypothetical protein